MNARRRSSMMPSTVPTPREDLSTVLVVLVLAALGATATVDAPVPAPIVAEAAPVDLVLQHSKDGAWLDAEGNPVGIGALAPGVRVALAVSENQPLSASMAIAEQLMAAGIHVRLDISRTNAPLTPEKTQ